MERSSYQTIALLEVLYKGFSLIILEKLNNHFYKNKIISPLQFGFKPESSVAQAIWTFLDFKK